MIKLGSSLITSENRAPDRQKTLGTTDFADYTDD